MTRAPGPSQRARRRLNQAALYRAHRRGELNQVAPEQAAAALSPSPAPDDGASAETDRLESNAGHPPAR
jgi:hypothetical protein